MAPLAEASGSLYVQGKPGLPVHSRPRLSALFIRLHTLMVAVRLEEQRTPYQCLLRSDSKAWGQLLNPSTYPLRLSQVFLTRLLSKTLSQNTKQKQKQKQKFIWGWSQEHWLLTQRTWVRFPALTFTTNCNSNSRASSVLFPPL